MTRATSHSTLLMIAQVIALSDGSISEQEEQMIMELPKRLGIEAAAGIDSQALPSLSSLAQQLTTAGDRCLAARIAALVAGVSRNPGDEQDINALERTAYRELIAALDLDSSELEEIEWSVRQELSQEKSLLQRIGDALFGQGAWPDPQTMNPGPEIPGLG